MSQSEDILLCVTRLMFLSLSVSLGYEGVEFSYLMWCPSLGYGKTVQSTKHVGIREMGIVSKRPELRGKLGACMGQSEP